MSLTTVSTGGTISKGDLNQCINVLQRASGQTETGKYHLSGNSYVNGGALSVYIESLSRNATPVSVTIDTADTAPASMASPTTTYLNSNGFQIHSTTTAITGGANAGGNYTLQY